MMRKLLLPFLFCLISLIFITSCAQNNPLKIVLISGSNEYFSDLCLTSFKSHLEEKYSDVQVTLLQADGDLNVKMEYSNLDGLEALEKADAVLFYLRRTTIAGEQLERIRRYVQSQKSVVAIRTSSHGFQNWLEFDKEVLGGNYHGHYPGSPEEGQVDKNGRFYPVGQPTGPTCAVKKVKGAASHPIMKDIPDFKSRYSLYKTSPVEKNVQVLMAGTIPGEEPEPVVWCRDYNGARITYIGCGGLQDWDNTVFKKLVANALFWGASGKMMLKVLPKPEQRPLPTGTITLPLRSRIETQSGSARWQEISLQKELKINETAIIVCDMWDNHWCSAATERCTTLAQKMNPILTLAREKGIQIIHAPSSTMYYYQDWPQRQRMILAPEAPKPVEIEIDEPELPIDDSDGGCDSDDVSYDAWTRQSSYIDIGKYDGISDNGNEVYNFFQDQGIKNVIMTGVHTNMCVLGRSFAIRQMTKWGMNCYLVRDLTDAMYDPKDAPYVSHNQGTELVVRHIEKYWCPSLLSQDFVDALQ